MRREWGREDSNLRRLSRRVYSPFPLATRAHPREAVILAGRRRRLRRRRAPGAPPSVKGLAEEMHD
jgi:hypothetical protein